MDNNVWSSKVSIGTTFGRIALEEQETTRQARKTKSDIIYCTSTIKVLQQPQLLAAFVKYMGRMPWMIGPLVIGLGKLGTETRAVKIIVIYH